MVEIPSDYHDILDKKAFVHLATRMKDGSPQVSPVWAERDGNTIIINSAKGRLKDRNMRADDRVALSATDPDNPYRSIMIRGRVTKIASSAIQASATPGASTDPRGTNFKVEVTIEDKIPGVRPDFSCTAEITTATRDDVIAVPIQALTVREDEQDNEQEGVFVFRDGIVTFVAVEVGIAGERYFEVLSGLGEGDEVVTGPYSAVREIEDGDRVVVEDDADDDEGWSFSISLGA